MSLVKKFVCPKCNDGFSSKYNLKKHLQSVKCMLFKKQSIPAEEIVQIIESGSQQVICHVCKMKVSSRVELISHLRVEHSFNTSIETESFSSKEGNLHR